MYDEIEKEFIKKSQIRKNEIFMIIIGVIMCMLFILGLKIFKRSFLSLFILSIIIILLTFISLYLCVFFRLLQRKKYKIKSILKLKNNIELYRKYMHEEDLLILGIILEEHKITTIQSLKEIIDYYRTKLPKKILHSRDFISFLSLIISLIALFSADFFIKNQINVEYALLIILISFIIFWSVGNIKSLINMTTGKDELYKRIEKKLSEIYVQELLKK